MSKIITVPFGWLLAQLYQLTNSYGLAIIIFALLVKLILLPISAKSKKSSMKMSRLTPRVQDIQERYASDPQKQNEALQNLYKEEGVSMGGSCLWSLIPLLILLPLYTIIREPITYMLGQTAEVSTQIVGIIQNANPDLFTGNSYYYQIIAARYIPEYAEAIKAAIPAISDTALQGINFGFLGIDLGAVPTFNIFSAAWAWDVAHVGGLILPLLSAGINLLTTVVAQKMNNSLVTDKNGVQDKETAEKSQQAQSMQMMMWMMPLMSLWIGFTVPGALSLYWFIQGAFSMVQDVILTKRYRKLYDAEDAIRIQAAMERDREEAERERIRAERRAANPNGQTQNTSKKKITKQLQQQEEAAKAAAAREYAAKRGALPMEEEPETSVMSGIPGRPYCKGRNYDPDRYNHTEE